MNNTLILSKVGIVFCKSNVFKEILKRQIYLENNSHTNIGNWEISHNLTETNFIHTLSVCYVITYLEMEKSKTEQIIDKIKDVNKFIENSKNNQFSLSDDKKKIWIFCQQNKLLDINKIKTFANQSGFVIIEESLKNEQEMQSLMQIVFPFASFMNIKSFCHMANNSLDIQNFFETKLTMFDACLNVNKTIPQKDIEEFLIMDKNAKTKNIKIKLALINFLRCPCDITTHDFLIALNEYKMENFGTPLWAKFTTFAHEIANNQTSRINSTIDNTLLIFIIYATLKIDPQISDEEFVLWIKQVFLKIYSTKHKKSN